MENIKLAVIGLGYVGLPLARLFATRYPVVGYDVKRERVAALMEGRDATQEVSARRHVVPHQGQRPDDSAAGLRGEKRRRRVRRHCPQPLPGRGLQPRRKLRHQPPERFEQRIGDLGHLSHLKFHFSTKITFLTETLRQSAEKSVLLPRNGPRPETAHKIAAICKIILSL